MARPIRIEYPGAVYHVICRSNNRQAVFRDDQDRRRYLEKLSLYCQEKNAALLSYCLLSNHVHLRVETPEGNLSKMMQAFQTSYRVCFNKGILRVRLAWMNKDQLFTYASLTLQLLAELVRLKVDIIVVAGGAATVRAAKNATKTIPIIMVGPGADPVEAGLVESLAHPGGNVTGLTNLVTQLGGKRLGLLKEVVPKLTRVAVLYNPVTPAGVRELNEVLPEASRGLGLTLQAWERRDADGFEKVFAAIVKWRADGMYVLTGASATVADQKQIVGFAIKSRLPSIYINRAYTDAGGLMYYGADALDSYRRVAYYVDRILKGAKPADLPVEQPMKFEFVINLKTAKQIGLTIPPNVLARADRVIS